MDRFGRIPPREFHARAEDLTRLRATRHAELSMSEIASLAGVSTDMRYRTIST